MKHMVAFDCGNSSCRVVLGTYDGSRITMEVISQTPNEMIQAGGRFYWDFLAIFQSLKKGLKEAAARVERIDSLGICTWGVDFGLFDADGNLLGAPLSYRNPIGEACLAGIPAEERAQMFQETGILCDKINSVYMLAGMKKHMPARVEAARRLLMVPDILNYLFTGRMVNEPSELSTTQLMDSRTRGISADMCRRFGIPETLFPPLGKHGEAIGNILPEIREELGVDYDIPVVCVPSHDTASAVFAVPAEGEEFLFVSSGTWSLIGTELAQPVINAGVREASLTNEVGAFDRITLLRNNAGMFINQCLKPEYQEQTGTEIGWDAFSELERQHTGPVPLFDVNAPRFFSTKSMSGAIRGFLTESGQTAGPASWPTLVRSYQLSLACSYGQVVRSLEALSGKTFPSVYIVGGGSRNARQNQLVADCLGKTVVACSKESTSLGCLAAQIACLEPGISVGSIRRVLRGSIETREYLPREDLSAQVGRYITMFAGKGV